MNVYVVIPARYGSTRFPGKPLQPIRGVPLLERVVRQVQLVKRPLNLLVATDDRRIEDCMRQAGVQTVMTDTQLQSGTDRIYQALNRSGFSVQENDIVVNVQGDEPLIPPNWIDGLIGSLESDKTAGIATLAHPIDWDEIENLNSVKVVVNQKNRALYFSRYPIPHSRYRGDQPLCLKHVGIYAYRFSALRDFCSNPPSALEIAESLEQLRAMDLGHSIHVVRVNGAIQGVDVPEDVFKVEKILKEQTE